MVGQLSKRLDFARSYAVEREQKHIKFCETAEWNDVEGDECDLGSAETGDNECRRGKKDTGKNDDSDDALTWEQWRGLVERGFKRTLVLFKLNPKKTKKRAPGPGPIKKVDWAPIADKYLKDRKVVFHTDGTKNYRLKTTPVRGIVHGWVVHNKKGKDGRVAKTYGLRRNTSKSVSMMLEAANRSRRSQEHKPSTGPGNS